MKRITSACLEQTIHFQLKEELGRETALAQVKDELAAYKAQLDKKRVQYRIISEEVQKDGSILLKIKKQYNTYSVGNYLD